MNFRPDAAARFQILVLGYAAKAPLLNDSLYCSVSAAAGSHQPRQTDRQRRRDERTNGRTDGLEIDQGRKACVDAEK